MATKDTGGQQKASRKDEDVEATTDQTEVSEDLKERHEKLDEDVETILDEIDGLLEENAEEFVRSFVQKGGE
jgi:prokaryotic ubiquitin-like protein Pup